MSLTAKDFKKIYRKFDASISEAYDCGRMCAPLNGGEPVCCSTDNAIPVVEKSEWSLLRGRTDLWSKFEPFDAVSKQIVDELADTCCAIECKGASHCERHNRTIACRAFPFFPYFTREREIVGLACYWTFEDRCWMISNLQVVEKPFVDELIAAYEYMFLRDEDERQAYIDQGASARRVFSRWKRPIPLIGRDGSFNKVLPNSGGKIVAAEVSDFKPHQNFSSDEAYRDAIEEWGGDPRGKTLNPDWSIKQWWLEEDEPPQP